MNIIRDESIYYTAEYSVLAVLNHGLVDAVEVAQRGHEQVEQRLERRREHLLDAKVEE